MPPTVKPATCATACFVRVSVVRIASAAARLRRRRGRRSRRATRRGVRQRQRRADDAGRQDEHLLGVEGEQPRRLDRGRARVELPAHPGGRIRGAGVEDDGLRLRQLEVLLRDLHRRGLHPVDGEHAAPVAGPSDRTTARSSCERRMPAWTPLATNPFAAVTLILGLPAGEARPSRRVRARGSRSGPPAPPHPCRGCRARRRRSPCPWHGPRTARSRRRPFPGRATAPASRPRGAPGRRACPRRRPRAGRGGRAAVARA